MRQGGSTGAEKNAAAVVALLLAWWIRPFDQLMAIDAGGNVNRMTPGVFVRLGHRACLGGPLFAFALGTAAGAVIRRTVLAMAAMLGGKRHLWMPLESARHHFLAPLTTHGPLNSTPQVPLSAYVLGNSYADASGVAGPVPASWRTPACSSMAARPACG